LRPSGLQVRVSAQPNDRTTLSAGNDNRFAIVDENLAVVIRSGIAAAGRLLE
jgi:hypothetical protein